MLEVAPGFLTVAEAAEVSGYCQQYIRALCRADKLICVKVGRSIIVKRSSLEAWKAKAEALGNQKFTGIK